MINAIQWNPPVQNEQGHMVPQDHMSGYQGHPKVRFTSYHEIFEILKTPGNSRVSPYWTWQVMGILETERGKLIVLPGDWIVELMFGYFIVMSNVEYNLFLSNDSTTS